MRRGWADPASHQDGHLGRDGLGWRIVDTPERGMDHLESVPDPSKNTLAPLAAAIRAYQHPRRVLVWCGVRGAQDGFAGHGRGTHRRLWPDPKQVMGHPSHECLEAILPVRPNDQAIAMSHPRHGAAGMLPRAARGWFPPPVCAGCRMAAAMPHPFLFRFTQLPLGGPYLLYAYLHQRAFLQQALSIHLVLRITPGITGGYAICDGHQIRIVIVQLPAQSFQAVSESVFPLRSAQVRP